MEWRKAGSCVLVLDARFQMRPLVTGCVNIQLAHRSCWHPCLTPYGSQHFPTDTPQFNVSSLTICTPTKAVVSSIHGLGYAQPWTCKFSACKERMRPAECTVALDQAVFVLLAPSGQQRFQLSEPRRIEDNDSMPGLPRNTQGTFEE